MIKVDYCNRHLSEEASQVLSDNLDKNLVLNREGLFIEGILFLIADNCFCCEKDIPSYSVIDKLRKTIWEEK